MTHHQASPKASYTPGTLFGLLDVPLPLYLVAALVAEILFTFYFNTRYELGLNAVASVILLVLTIIIIAVPWEDTQQDKSKISSRTISTITVLVSLSLFLLMATYACFAPEKGYVGVVREGNRSIRVIDSANVFMTPPSMFRDQSVTWYDIVPLEYTDIMNGGHNRQSEPMETFLREKWSKSYKAYGMGITLEVKANASWNLEGFKSLPDSGGDPIRYRDDLRREVQTLIDTASVQMAPTAQDFAELAGAINTTRNALYSLHDATITLTFEPPSAVHPGSLHSRVFSPTAAKANAGRAAYRRHSAAIFSAPHTRNNGMATFLVSLQPTRARSAATQACYNLGGARTAEFGPLHQTANWSKNYHVDNARRFPLLTAFRCHYRGDQSNGPGVS